MKLSILFILLGTIGCGSIKAIEHPYSSDNLNGSWITDCYSRESQLPGSPGSNMQINKLEFSDNTISFVTKEYKGSDCTTQVALYERSGTFEIGDDAGKGKNIDVTFDKMTVTINSASIVTQWNKYGGTTDPKTKRTTCGTSCFGNGDWVLDLSKDVIKRQIDYTGSMVQDKIYTYIYVNENNNKILNFDSTDGSHRVIKADGTYNTNRPSFLDVQDYKKK